MDSRSTRNGTASVPYGAPNQLLLVLSTTLVQLPQQPGLGQSQKSRRTVSQETLSTSAASSSVSPPKNRSSTTLPFRGSTADKALKAPSNTTKSTSGSLEITKASSRVSGWVPPPRLRLFLERQNLPKYAASIAPKRQRSGHDFANAPGRNPPSASRPH